MPRQVEILTQREVKRLIKEVERAKVAGEVIKSRRVADGNGLYLQIPEVSWIALFRFEGKRHQMGLKLSGADLENARIKNTEIRRLLAEGINPLAQRAARRARTALSKTFNEAARAFLEATRAERKSPKHEAQWTMTLLGETGKRDRRGQPLKSKFNYCHKIHDIPVGDITTDSCSPCSTRSGPRSP